MSNIIYYETPLRNDDIRVIRLLPGQWKDPIRCELVHTSLSSGKRYHALSYVWGSKEVTRNILLDGHLFQATVNLEGALRHLRHQYEDGLDLWVDALCINQNDLSERTHQVQLMGRIYESCESVLVYLGPGLGKTPEKGSAPSVMRFFDDKRDSQNLDNFAHGCSAWHSRRNVEGLRSFRASDVFMLIRALSKNNHFSEMSMFSPNREVANVESERMILLEALRKMMNPPWTPWWKRI
ncbi:hypothetical protein K491DRAFT_718770 [Lophiostoma macrostomum CBS 122681]|uniref:Heterokaryon incompatibility domain-containing protein n=1 Tax=Lophiostoma macrostomum CBS 122681 TaxID=1314788 RepID=A0A6A6SY06_9PLEO|nr:hypothetical protein K491DRAFT_718770 [Lophiostoma macrostomum CBS 122681]